VIEDQIRGLIEDRDSLVRELQNVKKEGKRLRLYVGTFAAAMFSNIALLELTAEYRRLGSEIPSLPFAYAILAAFAAQLVSSYLFIHLTVRWLFRWWQRRRFKR
jgi:hypothetical protein